MELLGYAAALYVFTFVCWVGYLAVMSLWTHLPQMKPFAKVHGIMLLLIFLPMDFVLNVVVGSLLFLDPPREWILTHRLKRHKHEGGWRGRLATWICVNLLDTFDPDGRHC